jgi:histidinol phosphatase-like enzyme (inositol monophosphatase family)
MTQTLTDQEVAILACSQGGSVAKSYFRSVSAENKATDGGYDPVTEGDKKAELRVREVLKTHRPDDAIFGEEFGRSQSTNNREWIIDPIDGTRAFVSGVPTWGTLVGLTSSKGYSVGAACQPIVGDLFAGDGDSATLNGAPIQARTVTAMSDVRIATTALDLLDREYIEPFEALSKQTAITRFGLDWYAYGLLASGGFDVVMECGLKPYDIAALIPIIRGAGGIITDIHGGDDIGPTVLASANDTLHEKVLKHFRG